MSLIKYEDEIAWWHRTYDEMLQKYFKYERLVKDDQIILTDISLKNNSKIKFYTENIPGQDNWFMFKRILN